MRFKENFRMPEKLSECIMLALDDLEKVEQDKRFKVDMDVWCEPAKKTCAVCFAGSVMVKSAIAGQPSTSLELEPDSFGLHNRNRFCALNQIRTGNAASALMYLPLYNWETIKQAHDAIRGLNVSNYEVCQEQFKEDMLWVAGILDAEGL
jgi:hypothetical protein